MLGLRQRQFITLLGGAAAWPLAVRAQADRVRRVGALMGTSADDPVSVERRRAFQKRLEQLGWKFGATLQTESRGAAAAVEPLRANAAELLELQPDVIFASRPRPWR